MNRRAIFITLAVSTFGFVAAQTPGPAGGASEPSSKSIPKGLTEILESGTASAELQPASKGLKVTGSMATATATADGAAASPVETTEELVTIAPNQKSEQLENGPLLWAEPQNAGNATVNPKELTLHAPYPAKPLAAAPAGWHLAIADNAPHHVRVVQLANGVKVALSIKPHILIPESDGSEIFAISEPGYDSARGDQQTTTVSAILNTSINQLDEDCIQLGSAIESLQQLLISLPKPEIQSEIPTTQGKKR